MARRKFAKLKALMYEREVIQADLAEALGRSQTYIVVRMGGKEPWNLEDIQAIGTMLEIPREQWLDFFIDSPTPGREAD